MTERLEVNVGLHQGSALTPFIFSIVMDVMTEEVREAVPWSILYADDILLCAETLEMKLDRWTTVMVDRGMRIRKTEIEYYVHHHYWDL